MVNRKKLALRLHGLVTRYTPAMWAIFVLVPMIPALASFRITDPATWFAAWGFWLAGGVFIYDAVIIWPQKGKISGMISAVVILALGLINIVLGFMILFGLFNPFVGSSPWTPVATITLLLGVIGLLVAGTVETILGRHYGKELAAKFGKKP